MIRNLIKGIPIVPLQVNMTIKELKKILELAQTDRAEVFIEDIENKGASTTKIHWNYDDEGNLDLAKGTNR